MSYEPTLTATLLPSPRVRVDFNTLHVDTASVTVYRSYEDEVTKVRDGINKFAVGGFTVTDYEIPLGVTVWYAAEMFDAAGVSLGVTGNSDTVLYGEPGYMWASDPLDLTRAIEVQLADSFLSGGVIRPRPVQKYPIGSDVVALSGLRQLITGVRLDCFTETQDRNELLDSILGAGLVLFRTMPGVELPRLLYVYTDTPRKVPWDHHLGGEFTQWQITADQVTPPLMSAGVFEGTWQDVIDNFATWTDLMAAYSTWLDLLKNPPGV